MSDDRPVKAEHINRVLLAVRECEPLSGDVQLSILCFALVVACSSCKVDKNRALNLIRRAFNQPIQMVPLAPGQH